MEETKTMESEGFIKHVDDEVDIRVGTNSISNNEKAKNEISEKKPFPLFWARKKVKKIK